MATWRKKLEKFLEFLNCYYPTMKFTLNYSREKINCFSQKDNHQLVTVLYIKPKDRRQYLHARHHPFSTYAKFSETLTFLNP